MNIGGIGPDYGDGFQLLQIERQEMIVVLEQHNRFLRHLQSQLLMLRAIRDVLGIVRIDVGIFEQAEAELRLQHAFYGLIQFRFGHPALANLVQKRGVYRTIGQVVVHARGQRLSRGLREVGSHVVSLHQHLQAISVRGHVASETPFLAQHAIEQPAVDMVRDAVDLVVRGHHTANLCLFDGGAERHKKGLTQIPLRKIGGCGVGAALRLAMGSEVLGRRHHVMPVNRPRSALQPVDGRHAHVGDEVGVFTIGFFGASPTWITRQIQHRAKGLIHSRGCHLVPGSLEGQPYQFRIPCAGQAQHLRKAGAAISHESMQSLALKNCGYAQARCFHQEMLRFVARLGGVVRADLRVLAI